MQPFADVNSRFLKVCHKESKMSGADTLPSKLKKD